MRDAVIVGAVRTPVGKRNGGFAQVHPVDLGGHILQALARRAGFDPAQVDDVIFGCVSQSGEQSWNVGRNVVLAAGWPASVPGTTLDRQCGSSQQAVHFAAATVLSGQADLVVAGGVEVMSRVPMGSSAQDKMPYGERVRERYRDEEGFAAHDQIPFSQGVGAEMMASRWGLSRGQLDEYSLASHEKAAAASFEAELAPYAGVLADEGIRRDTTLAKLGSLPTPFRPDGVVTAGSASQISDGAAALAITTSEFAAQQGLTPLARIHTAVVAGDDPVIMLTAPIPATAKALAKAGLSISDIGVFEVNEAFAPVPLAWLKETGAAPERLNPRGGAIALGHPLGATGARLMTSMLYYQRDNGIRYGLQTMCEGGGMANATILEVIA
ncbi:acetyl-CoA acyltransferase [Rhizocola hellebori]|uniref:Acetyl-CoA acyltransferase n=1 Tax=Rhizocola hellebori TaxID=1392758 RepID=A0A8J3VKM5_9ACTN|nr:acetyl-CoA C-acyltransferase [Rhizocola hellebori]GIH09895.1 acetyl-CoA acyltransferase [Rhizocola hellebori]